MAAHTIFQAPGFQTPLVAEPAIRCGEPGLTGSNAPVYKISHPGLRERAKADRMERPDDPALDRQAHGICRDQRTALACTKLLKYTAVDQGRRLHPQWDKNQAGSGFGKHLTASPCRVSGALTGALSPAEYCVLLRFFALLVEGLRRR